MRYGLLSQLFRTEFSLPNVHFALQNLNYEQTSFVWVEDGKDKTGVRANDVE